MSQYPKWLYHATHEARVVPDEAAHKALGSGWHESPVDAKAAPVKPAIPLIELEHAEALKLNAAHVPAPQAAEHGEAKHAKVEHAKPKVK